MTTDEKLDTCLKLLEKQGKDIERINRGLYGDPDNKLHGLIDRQIRDEKRIHDLEQNNDRRKWWTGGVIAALTLVFSFLWQWIKDLFK